MVLGVVRDPHEAARRGGEQELADRGVDSAVGDVEQSLPFGCFFELTVETGQRVGLGCGGREKVSVVVHDVAPPG